MAELENLFNSPPGQSSRPPRPRTPSPSPSLSPSPTPSPSVERRRLSSQPLFLSPNGTATPIRSRSRQHQRQEQRDEVQRRMQFSPGPGPLLGPGPGPTDEVDPFEETVTTGNLGVYDPLAPILGDEEPARKKRKPIPKIDAERLMGEYGLPALMKDAKRFKVKGKGHEAQDLKSLLSTYQIWAHRMFPRGDFMGTMGRVENVLRTRRMENAMKGYKESFHPPPPSPPLPLQRHRTSSPNLDITFDSDPDLERDITSTATSGLNGNGNGDGDGNGSTRNGERGDEPLFDEADLDEMAAMEEMEREAMAGSGNGNGDGNGSGNGIRNGHGYTRGGDDGPPPQLEEEDDWEGLYE